MDLLHDYASARHDEEIARLRRALALRALVASRASQRQIAEGLGVSQSAVSQQLKSASKIDSVHPEALIEAAGRNRNDFPLWLPDG